MQVFDAIIVIASFTLDLVFLDGIATTEGEDAIAIIIIFLLWRILRVINGKHAINNNDSYLLQYVITINNSKEFFSKNC